MSLADPDKLSDYSRLINVATKVLQPIVGILLRAGVPFSTFANVARRQYVDVAQKDFGVHGRRTNTSRIAMLTGLTRAKVKRELDLLNGANQHEDIDGLDQVRHASRMLLGWHTNPRFCDANGKPRKLFIDAESPSFAELYEEYSGKVVPVTSMLKELIAVGAVEQMPDERVIARCRSYTPQASDPAALDRICQAINDLATTTSINLYSDTKKGARFERFATNQLIDASKEKEFREFLELEGQVFLERIDNWLSRAESKRHVEQKVRVGIGLYQISSDPIDK